MIRTKTHRELIGTYRSYVRAVEAAGGDCIVLTPNRRHISNYLTLLDGLMLTGGGDIHPKFFRARMPKVKLDLSPDERTRFELAITRAFVRNRKPFLGVCLGCQTLNVALGGNLIQDLPSEKPGTREHRKGEHWIHLAAGSRLRKILGRTRVRVNSRHHQAIGRPGRRLKTVALSPDDVVEAIETTNRTFALGIQWHPEEIPHRSESRKLFRAFIRACQRRS